MDNADMFNRKLADFLDDLEAIGINSVAEYPMLKASCSLLAQMDKSRPAQIFFRYILSPYEDQIATCDEQFFLSEQLTETKDMAIVNAIRQIWKNLDSGNKAAIWKHMQVLMVLSRRVANPAPR